MCWPRCSRSMTTARPPMTPEELDFARAFIDGARWQYAASVPEAPHECLLDSWNDDAAFACFAALMARHGHRERYADGWTYTYLPRRGRSALLALARRVRRGVDCQSCPQRSVRGRAAAALGSRAMSPTSTPLAIARLMADPEFAQAVTDLMTDEALATLRLALSTERHLQRMYADGKLPPGCSACGRLRSAGCFRGTGDEGDPVRGQSMADNGSIGTQLEDGRVLAEAETIEVVAGSPTSAPRPTPSCRNSRPGASRRRAEPRRSRRRCATSSKACGWTGTRRPGACWASSSCARRSLKPPVRLPGPPGPLADEFPTGHTS
jgi:hypothetical protein